VTNIENDDELVDGGLSTEPKREYLKSLKGAWVELVQMPYGDVLARQDMVMDMKVQMADRKSKGGGMMEMKMANVETTANDFAKCIVHHNIRNPRTGRAFQFKNRMDWYGILDPKVGKEIDKYISDLNGFGEEDEDFTENSADGSGLETGQSQQ
jgi:hypothetical protein